jgi:hypothetical protein
MVDAQPLEPRTQASIDVGTANAAQFQSEGSVLMNRGVQEQWLLKHASYASPKLKLVTVEGVLTTKQDSPSIGALQHPHHPKQCRFSGSVGTDQR